MRIKNIYTFLYKAFYYDIFTYEVFSPKVVVVEELDNYFLHTTGFFNYRKFKGGFVDYPDTFYVSSVGRRPAYLKGVVRDTTSNKTEIEIAVRANEMYLVFFVLCLLCVPVALYGYISTGHIGFLWGVLWFVFANYAFIFRIARRDAYRMRKSLEEQLNIQPESIDEGR